MRNNLVPLYRCCVVTKNLMVHFNGTFDELILKIQFSSSYTFFSRDWHFSVSAGKKKGEKRYNVNYTYDLLKELRHQYKAECQKQKQKSFRTFIEASNTNDKTAKLSRILNSTHRNDLGLLTDDNGNMLSPEATIQKMCDTHFEGLSLIHI